MTLWQQGIKTIIGTDIGIVVMAMLFYYFGHKLKNNSLSVLVSVKDNNSDNELLALQGN